MSKEKEIEKGLHLFLKLKTLDAMLYSSIITTKHVFPGTTLEAAIHNFMEAHNLSEEEFNLDSAKQTFNRTNNYIKQNGSWK